MVANSTVSGSNFVSQVTGVYNESDFKNKEEVYKELYTNNICQFCPQMLLEMDTMAALSQIKRNL